MRSILFGIFRAANQFVHQPILVFWFCLALAFVNLVVDGTILQVWALRRDHQALTLQSQNIQTELAKVRAQLLLAKDPAFFERQARDRFDLVNEKDLVFVFAEDE